jgi:hypothetical protein
MKRNLKFYTVFISLAFIFLGLTAQAQNERKFVRQGNKFYEQALADTSRQDTASYNKAEIAYRRAIEKRPDDLKWNFNLGDALYKQQKFDQAQSTFEDIAKKSSDKTEKARAYHNIGNSLLMQKKLDESIEAYKEALRNNPKDLDSKYNLLYAMNLKKQQQQQQKNQDQNKDQNKDKDKDKNKDQGKDKDKDKDKQDQNKDQNKDQQDQNKNKDQQNKDQQNKDQQKQNQDQQQQQQQQQPQKISKENAERLLQALQNDEEKIQEKVKKAQAAKAQQRQTDKDW